MKRGCIQRQPGRERQIAGEGTAVLGGSALQRGPVPEPAGLGWRRQDPGQAVGGLQTHTPLLFPHRRAPSPSPGSTTHVSLQYRATTLLVSPPESSSEAIILLMTAQPLPWARGGSREAAGTAGEAEHSGSSLEQPTQRHNLLPDATCSLVQPAPWCSPVSPRLCVPPPPLSPIPGWHMAATPMRSQRGMAGSAPPSRGSEG